MLLCRCKVPALTDSYRLIKPFFPPHVYILLCVKVVLFTHWILQSSEDMPLIKNGSNIYFVGQKNIRTCLECPKGGVAVKSR